MFLHPYAETTWEDQLTKESLVERTVRAVVHAKRTLMAGYTAVRCVRCSLTADRCRTAAAGRKDTFRIRTMCAREKSMTSDLSCLLRLV